MKYTVLLALAVAVGATTAMAQTGNEAPNGAHYNLNILGKRDCAPADLTGSNRHTIQVLLNGGQSAADIDGTLALTLDKKNKILLVPGDDFQVLDGNACDGAKFMLPTNITYAVYARALGTPGGYADMTTCAVDDNLTPTDPTDDVVVCSMATLNLTRTKGGQKFENVTDKLTTITFIDSTGVQTTVSIFDTALYDYFWNYDNHGLRLAQLRFYPLAAVAAPAPVQ